MTTEKTEGIILRVVEFSESSCVVTLLTRDFGKITGIAKGARRRKSPFEAAIDLLAVVRLVFVHKTSTALDILTEAKLQRRFRSASTHLDRLYAAFYCAEILLAMTDENDPHRELYDFAVRMIQNIDDGENLDHCVIRFQLQTLKLLGHGPELNNCVGCGNTIPSEKRYFFGLRDGGVFCADCRRAKKAVASMSAESLELMQQFADPNYNWQRTESSSKQIGEVRALTLRYTSHVLGYEPKLQKYIEKRGT